MWMVFLTSLMSFFSGLMGLSNVRSTGFPCALTPSRSTSPRGTGGSARFFPEGRATSSNFCAAKVLLSPLATHAFFPLGDSQMRMFSHCPVNRPSALGGDETDEATNQSQPPSLGLRNDSAGAHEG